MITQSILYAAIISAFAAVIMFMTAKKITANLTLRLEGKSKGNTSPYEIRPHIHSNGTMGYIILEDGEKMVSNKHFQFYPTLHDAKAHLADLESIGGFTRTTFD